MKVLLIGKNGQLGMSFQKLAPHYPEFEWSFAGKESIDLLADNLREILNSQDFHIIINAAAYTAVDKAESDSHTAFLINAEAVKIMSEICLNKNALLVHFSSDYVYNNAMRRPLKESDPTSPVGVYASSKLEGEKLILNSGCKTLIFRTSWVISPFGHNFVKTMLNLSSKFDSLKVVSDQTGAPTLAEDLAIAVCEIIKEYAFDSSNFNKFGIYNYANSGETNWSTIAQTIFEHEHLNTRVLPISTEEYNAAAHRPRYSVLDTSKISEHFALTIPHWIDALKRCLAQLSLK